MNKLKKNESGFSAVEVILVLVIVALLGVVGWFVYKNQNKSTPSTATTTNTTTSTPAKTTTTTPTTEDITAKWLQYDSPDNKYSIKIPDGWNLVSYHSGSSPYTTNIADITYKKDLKATVKNTDFAGDVVHVAFAMASPSFFSNDPQGTVVSTLKTNAGLTVTKYRFFMEKDPEFMDIPKGTTRYDYRVIDGTKKFQIVHDILTGEKEQTEWVEQSIKTLQLK